MITFNPYKYVFQDEFNKDLSELSKFRDSQKSWNLHLQRIGSSCKILTAAKPGFWKRFCSFFYKPHSLRLRSVVEKTISILETNKCFINSYENLQKLQSFRSGLLRIRTLHKKVHPSILAKLSTLIENIEKEFGNVAAKELEDAKKTAEEAEKNRAEILKQSEINIAQLKKETEQTIEEGVKAKEKFREDQHLNRWLYKIQLEIHKESNFSFESLRSDTNRQTVHIECSLGQVVTVHPEFFNTLYQKEMEKQTKQGKLLSTPIKVTVFEMKENVEKLVSWCYGVSETVTIIFNEFLRYCLLSQQLFVTDLSKQLGEAYESQLKIDPGLSINALENFKKRSYQLEEQREAETSEESIENRTLKFLLSVKTVDLEVPKKRYSPLVDFLKNFKSPHAPKLLDKWKAEGLI